jgi:hypothetical protein
VSLVTEIRESGKSRTENKWNVSGMEQFARLVFSKRSASEERAADRQKKTTVPGDNAECCSVGEIGTYCYVELAALIPKPNHHWISRYKFPQPFFTLSVPMLSVKASRDLMLSAKLHGITYHKATNVI